MRLTHERIETREAIFPGLCSLACWVSAWSDQICEGASEIGNRPKRLIRVREGFGGTGVAEGDGAHASSLCGVDAGRGVLDREAVGGGDGERGGGVEVAVREGLGALDIVGGGDGAEVVMQADRLEHRDDDRGA